MLTGTVGKLGTLCKYVVEASCRPGVQTTVMEFPAETVVVVTPSTLQVELDVAFGLFGLVPKEYVAPLSDAPTIYKGNVYFVLTGACIALNLYFPMT